MDMIRQTLNELIDETLSRMPEPMAEHLGNAQKELLKAVQAAIDEQVKWIDIHLSHAKERRARRRQRGSERSEPTAKRVARR